MISIQKSLNHCTQIMIEFAKLAVYFYSCAMLSHPTMIDFAP